ncbi:MAG: c-type cytochrome [Pseudobdellovibrionaceae bacterium]
MISESLNFNSTYDLFFISRFSLYLITLTTVWFLIAKNLGLLETRFKSLMLINIISVILIFILGIGRGRIAIFEPFTMDKLFWGIMTAYFSNLTLLNFLGLVQQKKRNLITFQSLIFMALTALLALVYSLALSSTADFFLKHNFSFIQSSVGAIFNGFFAILVMSQSYILFGQQAMKWNWKDILPLTSITIGSIFFYQRFSDSLRVLGFFLILISCIFLLFFSAKALRHQLNLRSNKGLFSAGAVFLTLWFFLFSLNRQFLVADFQIYDILIFLPVILIGLLPHVSERSLNSTNLKIYLVALSLVFISSFVILILAHQSIWTGDVAKYLHVKSKSHFFLFTLFTLSTSLFCCWIIRILPNEIDDPKNTPQTTRVWEREKSEPDEGDRPWPLLVWVSFVTFISWGTIYFILYAGDGQVSGGDNRSYSEAAVAKTIDGSQVYTTNCAACHQASGQGLAGAFPPLAGSEWVLSDSKLPVKILLGGLQGLIEVKGNTYNGIMPAFNHLNDAEIAAVVSYIRMNWGNNGSEVDSKTVVDLRQEFKSRGKPWNPEELKAMLK